MDDELIDRGEIMGLLFNVADVVAILRRIERLLEDDDGEEEEEADSG